MYEHFTVLNNEHVKIYNPFYALYSVQVIWVQTTGTKSLNLYVFNKHSTCFWINLESKNRNPNEFKTVLV